jgi:hypothetical protein
MSSDTFFDASVALPAQPAREVKTTSSEAVAGRMPPVQPFGLSRSNVILAKAPTAPETGRV